MTMASVSAPSMGAMDLHFFTTSARPQPATVRGQQAGCGEAPDDAFARLASLVASNDRHLAEMRVLNARLAEAIAYLETAPPDPTLGRAYLDRVRSRRSAVLALLRANRIAAREFLSR
jgi:hypothetical protein